MNVCYGSPDELWLQHVEVEALETVKAACQVFHTLFAAEVSGGALVESHEMLRDVVPHQGCVNVKFCYLCRQVMCVVYTGDTDVKPSELLLQVGHRASHNHRIEGQRGRMHALHVWNSSD